MSDPRVIRALEICEERRKNDAFLNLLLDLWEQWAPGQAKILSSELERIVDGRETQDEWRKRMLTQRGYTPLRGGK